MQQIKILLYPSILLLNILITPLFACTQIIREITNREGISIRGMSVVSDDTFWISGSKGTVGRTIDGGKTMEWMRVPDYSERDFRDIEAINAKTAIIMAIDTPAVILKTKDGGKTWKKVFEDKRAGMFLDALYFTDKKNGVVVGDPVNDHFFMATTKDRGEHWKVIPAHQTAIAEKGEALFAASGTNILFVKNQPLFVSGGIQSHLIKGSQKILLPMIMNQSSTGANSIAMSKDGRIIIAGGDYKIDTLSAGNCMITDDDGKTFVRPQTNPFGYKSSIAYLGNRRWISCGTSGVDISTDHGINWKHISDESFHVVQQAKKGNKIFLAGSNGKIAEFNQSSD